MRPCWGVVVVVGLIACRKPAAQAVVEEPDPPAATAPHAIAIGISGRCLLDDGGQAQCWGAGEGCQPTPEPVPGADHLAQLWGNDNTWCGLRRDGQVVCWGLDFELTTPRFAAGAAPVVALAPGGLGSCALHGDGEVTCWDDELTAAPVAGLRPATAIASGGSRTCVVDRDGGVRCWGTSQCDRDRKAWDAAAIPHDIAGLDHVAHVAVNDELLCAVSVTGAVSCSDCSGRPVVAASTQTDAIDVDLDLGQGGCVLRRDGTVRCWTPDLPEATVVPGLDDAIAFDVGNRGACARRRTGEVVCWGEDDVVGVGLDELAPARAEPAPGLSGVTQVAVTGDASFALLDDGRVIGWGERVEPSTAVFEDVAAIAGSRTAICAVERGGAVRCWHIWQDGSAPQVIAGVSGAVAIAANEDEGCAIADHRVVCWNHEDPRPVVVAGTKGAVRVVGGYKHTCALLGDGTARCWYEPDDPSDIDTPALPERVTTIAAGGELTCALVGDVPWCWRMRETPQAITELTGARAVSSESDRICAVLNDGHVACTGRTYGPLCAGEDIPLGDDVAGLESIRVLAMASNHACALDDAGGVHCWGSNGDGQLGYPDIPRRFAVEPEQTWPITAR